MKFNEKLIEFRKKEGLSQEELGYKLNVTRQTVSKWELGQTTPEMDKLIEMSKIFNISVDQLVNETEEINNEQTQKIEDQPIVENGTKNKSIIVILIVALVIVLSLIGAKAFLGKNKTDTNSQGSIFDKIFGIFDKTTNIMSEQMDLMSQMQNEFKSTNTQDMLNNFGEEYNTLTDTINNNIKENKNEYDISRFNSSIELYSGSSSKGIVVHVLDNIITSNKKNDRKITVKYNKTETQEESKIRSVKQKIDKANLSEKFEVICEYDEKGYIYKVIIEKF